MLDSAVVSTAGLERYLFLFRWGLSFRLGAPSINGALLFNLAFVEGEAVFLELISNVLVTIGEFAISLEYENTMNLIILRMRGQKFQMRKTKKKLW